MSAQQFFTAAELAAAATARGLEGFSRTERGVQLLAERKAWDAFPRHLARLRPVRDAGGRPAMEYHLTILPEALQGALAGAAVKARLAARVAQEGEADRRKLATLKTSQLQAAARTVMEARAEVLSAIDGYAASQGRPRAWAIAAFLEAQEAWQARQDVEARRDDGEILTEREVVALAARLVLTASDGFDLQPARLAVANDRKARPIIKRSAIYDWFKARDAQGVFALAPVPPRVQQPIPAGFAEFLKFYARPSKPDLTDAHAQYLKNATGQPLTLHQVKYILRHRMNNIERHVGREGLLTLRSRLPYVTRPTDDMWPTTVYSADGKTFDAEIADRVNGRPIRPEITTVIDIVTRKIVGLSLARSENQRSVAEALRNACCSHGIPAIFYVDRGPGYRNEAMDADVGGLMGRLGITKSHAAPYGSQAKGRIEIVNKTVWNILAKRLADLVASARSFKAEKPMAE